MRLIRAFYGFWRCVPDQKWFSCKIRGRTESEDARGAVLGGGQEDREAQKEAIDQVKLCCLSIAAPLQGGEWQEKERKLCLCADVHTGSLCAHLHSGDSHSDGPSDRKTLKRLHADDTAKLHLWQKEKTWKSTPQWSRCHWRKADTYYLLSSSGSSFSKSKHG